MSNNNNEKKARDTSAKILNADMTDDMSDYACKTVETAFNNSTSEKQMADAIRKEFNETHDPIWNVIVGRHFGSDVTHATKKYINVEIGHLSVLVWKSN